jgi:hypothetical protein
MVRVMIWKEYFKLPFQLLGSKVLDVNAHMVFDFMQPWLDKSETVLVLSKSDQQRVVDCINNDYILKKECTFSFEGIDLFLNDLQFGRIRGWGYLTGVGGCKLDSDKAVEIQNSLGEYIISKLNER